MATATADPLTLLPFSRHALQPALALCAGLTDAKSPMPRLSTVHATWQAQAMVLVATDLQVTVRQTIRLPQPCPNGVKAEALIPLQRWRQIVALLEPDAHFTMDVETAKQGQQLTIREGKTTWRLPLEFGPEAFPAAPVPEPDAPWGTVDSDHLQALCRMAHVAYRGTMVRDDDYDASKARLMGIHLTATGGSLEAIASDAVHLLRKAMPWAGAPLTCCLPVGAALFAGRWLTMHAGRVAIAVDNAHIWLRDGEDWLCAQRLAATLPDVSGVIPAPDETPMASITCRKEDLDLALRCCKVSASGQPIKVMITAEDATTVSLRRYTTEGAGGEVWLRQAHLEQPAAWKPCEGDGVRLLGALQYFASEQVQLWQRHRHPVLQVRGLAEADAETQYVLMPFVREG